MNKVRLTVSSRHEVNERVFAAFRGDSQGAVISFSSPEMLWKILTKKRWAMLKSMVGQGPMTIRGLARKLGRDVKAVHGDVHTLINSGLVDRIEDGRVVFPYDGIHVDFELNAA